MFPSDLENAYAHEVERRKDEMRDAAKHRLGLQRAKVRKSVVIPIALLSIIAGLLVIMIGH